MTLLQLHLVAVSFWLGVVAVEMVLEFSARDAASRRMVAVVHGRIDLLIEIPVVIAVAVTGAMLLARFWPPSALLWVKSSAGLVAVIANVVCIPLVRARLKAADDERQRTLTRQVKMTAWAAPFALAAMLIGLRVLP